MLLKRWPHLDPIRLALALTRLAEIEDKRATLFAPDIVDATLRLFREKEYQLTLDDFDYFLPPALK